MESVKEIESTVWGDKIREPLYNFASGGIHSNNPLVAVPAAAAQAVGFIGGGIVDAFLPPSDPTSIIKYDDGTTRVAPGGGPSTGDLAALPTVLAPGSKALPLGSKSVQTTVRGAKPLTETPTPLHRPYKRKEFRDAVEEAAPRTPDGRYIDPNTGQIIEGQYHYGHRFGHEHRRLVKQAQERGMSQSEFNDWINRHPEWFQIEDPMSNMRHLFEKPGID